MSDLLVITYMAKDKFEQKGHELFSGGNHFEAEHDIRIVIDPEKKIVGTEYLAGKDLTGISQWGKIESNNDVHHFFLELIAASLFPEWPRHWTGDLLAEVLAHWAELDKENAETARKHEMERAHLAGATIEAGEPQTPPEPKKEIKPVYPIIENSLVYFFTDIHPRSVFHAGFIPLDNCPSLLRRIARENTDAQK